MTIGIQCFHDGNPCRFCGYRTKPEPTRRIDMGHLAAAMRGPLPGPIAGHSGPLKPGPVMPPLKAKCQG